MPLHEMLSPLGYTNTVVDSVNTAGSISVIEVEMAQPVVGAGRVERRAEVVPLVHALRHLPPDR